MKHNSSAKFRRVNAHDIDTLRKIVSLNDPDIVELMSDDVSRWLTSPRTPEAFYAVELEGYVVGMGGYVPDVWGVPDIAWLVWFYFDPSHQRQGLGAMLYDKIEAELERDGIRKIYLDVGNEADHTAAIAFHHANGYQREGTLPDFWQDGEDLLIFGKRLRRQVACD